MGLIRQLGITIFLLLMISGCSDSKGATGGRSDDLGLEENTKNMMPSTKLQLEDVDFLTLELVPSSEEEGSYLRGQFQNNSDQTIRWINLNLVLPGEIPHNLSFYYTVLPGEISPIQQRLVELEEMKGEIILDGVSIEYVSPDQSETYFYYDGMTQSAKWVNKGAFICQTPPFEVDELHLQEFQLINDEVRKKFYMSGYLKNSSIYKLSEITYSYLLPNGSVETLSVHQRLFPGERSSKVAATGPGTINLDEVQLLKVTYTIDEEEQSTHVEYDAKLDCYQAHRKKK